MPGIQKLQCRSLSALHSGGYCTTTCMANDAGYAARTSWMSWVVVGVVELVVEVVEGGGGGGGASGSGGSSGGGDQSVCGGIG